MSKVTFTLTLAAFIGALVYHSFVTMTIVAAWCFISVVCFASLSDR